MKKSFEKLKGLVLKDKKILYATLGVVILLIIIFAVVVTAGGGKEEPGDNGTKLANNNSKSEDDSPSSEESTTYPDEIQTKEDGTIVSVVTQSGQTLNLAEAQTEIDAEGNTIFTTQKGDKVILDNKGSVHVTENKTEESTTPTQKVTDTPTQKPTDAPTQKPTDAPTQKPTDAPTQKPIEQPTGMFTKKPVPADWAKSAIVTSDYYFTQSVQSALMMGFDYPTMEYSNIKSVNYLFPGLKEWYNTLASSNGVIDYNLGAFPYPLYKIVNWNGKIGFFRASKVDYDSYTGNKDDFNKYLHNMEFAGLSINEIDDIEKIAGINTHMDESEFWLWEGYTEPYNEGQIYFKWLNSDKLNNLKD